jgi:indolepyruvate decarboxylase
MYGVEAVRYGLVDSILAAARQLNVPVVSTMLARDYAPEVENYFGVYLGGAGAWDAKALVDESDFILMLGEDVSDVNFGMRTAQVRGGDIVRCIMSKVKTHLRTYEGIALAELVTKLSEAQSKPKWYNLPPKPVQTPTAQSDMDLTSDRIIDTLNRFYAENGQMPTITDTGELLFATLRLEASSIIGASYYGTMGLAIPAAIGYARQTSKRPLVLVGDGAFQMTGQEICHCSKLGINPICIVSNNGLWGMEQQFHPSPINSLVNWPYTKIAELWGGKSYTCKTQDELYKALIDAKTQSTFCLIEAQTDSNVPPEPLAKYVAEQKGASFEVAEKL